MTGILILGGFFVFAGLMIAKKLPTILALPLLAAWIALAAQMPLTVYLNNILVGGAMKLGTAMSVVLFGAMFARVIVQTGISTTIIKKAAELAGDKPRSIALLLSLATIFVFLGMSGLGAVIMVGSIVLPIMMSAGITPAVASTIFLLSIQTGLLANAANCGTYIGIFGGEVTTNFYLPAFTISFAFTLLCIFINVRQQVADEGTSLFAILGILVRGVMRLPVSICTVLYTQGKKALQPRETSLVQRKHTIPAAALLAPLLPLVTVYLCKIAFGFGAAAQGHIDPVAAAVLGFFVASFYAIGLTKPSQMVNVFAGSLVEGIKDVAGVIFLFMGIGMLLAVVMNPAVAQVLNPLLVQIIPTNHWALLAFFAVLAPTALYRGPLNMFGMGAGIAVLLHSLGIMPPAVIVGTFLAVGYIQGASDPTNSHNSWIGGFTKVDTTELLCRTLPYSWSMCLVMLLYVALSQW